VHSGGLLIGEVGKFSAQLTPERVRLLGPDGEIVEQDAEAAFDGVAA